ncbi:MAG: Ig-like domain-containing protein, partial [Bacteroidales bacterium]
KVRVSTTDDSGIYTDTPIAVVNQVLVESISLSSPAIKIDEPGGSLQFTATVLPQEAFNKDLQWEIIAGSSIATITQEGLLQARGERDGSVTIRVSATDGSGIYKEITIQVTNQVSSVHNVQENKFRAWYTEGLIRYIVPPSKVAGRIAVYSIDGKLMEIAEISANKKEGELKLKLRNGIYLVKIQKGEQYFYSKIAVNR